MATTHAVSGRYRVHAPPAERMSRWDQPLHFHEINTCFYVRQHLTQKAVRDVRGQRRVDHPIRLKTDRAALCGYDRIRIKSQSRPTAMSVNPRGCRQGFWRRFPCRNETKKSPWRNHPGKSSTRTSPGPQVETHTHRVAAKPGPRSGLRILPGDTPNQP